MPRYGYGGMTLGSGMLVAGQALADAIRARKEKKSEEKERKEGLAQRLAMFQTRGPGTFLERDAPQLLPFGAGLLQTRGNWMPKVPQSLVRAATKKEGGLPGLTQKQREWGTKASELMGSKDPVSQAVGASLMQRVLSGDSIIQSPNGGIYAWDGFDASTIHAVTNAAPPNMKFYEVDNKIIAIDPQTMKPQVVYSGTPEQKLSIEQREKSWVDKHGYRYKQRIDYALDKATGEEVWSVEHEPALAVAQTTDQLIDPNNEIVTQRRRQQIKDAKEDTLNSYKDIAAKLQDPVYGQEYLGFFTLPGRVKQTWREFKAWIGASKPGDPDYELGQKISGFIRDVQNAANLYIKDITGAQMSEAEAYRLLKAIANASDNPMDFMGKLEASIEQLSRVIDVYERRLKATGGNHEEARAAATDEKSRFLEEYGIEPDRYEEEEF